MLSLEFKNHLKDLRSEVDKCQAPFLKGARRADSQVKTSIYNQSLKKISESGSFMTNLDKEEAETMTRLKEHVKEILEKFRKSPLNELEARGSCATEAVLFLK